MRKIILLLLFTLCLGLSLMAQGEGKTAIFCRWCHYQVMASQLYCSNCARLLPRIKGETRSAIPLKYRYNKNGQVTQKIFKEEPQLTIGYSYKKGKLVRESWNSSYYRKSIQYTYTARGHLLKAMGKGGEKTLKFYFYQKNRLVRVVTIRSSASQIWEYQYDSLGRRTGAKNWVILLNSEGKLQYRKFTRWTYQRKGDKILGATVEEISNRQKDRVVKGKIKFSYTGEKISSMTTFLQGKKIRTLLFQ